jgi:hypothetical protein
VEVVVREVLAEILPHQQEDQVVQVQHLQLQVHQLLEQAAALVRQETLVQ